MASSFALEPAYKHDESDVIYMPVTAAQTFKKGALCVLSTGLLVECGANPAAINAIALCDASVGLDPRGSIYGGTNIPVIVPQPDTVFKLSSATTPVFATHVGNIYGVTKVGNVWQLDISKTTTNARFTVVGIGPVQGIIPSGGAPEYFLCKILPQYNSLSGVLS